MDYFADIVSAQAVLERTMRGDFVHEQVGDSHLVDLRVFVATNILLFGAWAKNFS